MVLRGEEMKVKAFSSQTDNVKEINDFLENVIFKFATSSKWTLHIFYEERQRGKKK